MGNRSPADWNITYQITGIRKREFISVKLIVAQYDVRSASVRLVAVSNLARFARLPDYLLARLQGLLMDTADNFHKGDIRDIISAQ